MPKTYDAQGETYVCDPALFFGKSYNTYSCRPKLKPEHGFGKGRYIKHLVDWEGHNKGTFSSWLCSFGSEQNNQAEMG